MTTLTTATQNNSTYYYKRDTLCACAYQLAMLRQRPAPHMIETRVLRGEELHNIIAELIEYEGK